MATRKTGGENLGVVSLRVSVPRGVLSLLRDLSRFGGVRLEPKAWIEGEIVQAATAIVDSIDNLEFMDKQIMLQRYGLDKKLGDP